MINLLINLKNNSLDKEQLSKFIASDFQNIYDFFHNQTQIELYEHRDEVKNYFKYAYRVIVSLDCSNKVNSDFIALMIDTSEKLNFGMEFEIFYNYLSKSNYTIGKRLESTKYYCIGIKKFDDYYERFPTILCSLKSAYNEENELIEVLTATFIRFYLNFLYNFGKYNGSRVIKLKSDILNFYLEKKYNFLDIGFVSNIFDIEISDFRETYNLINEKLNDYLHEKNIIKHISQNNIQIENNEYSQKLRELTNLTFDKIRQVSVVYINSISHSSELHNNLNRGTKIIDNSDELCQYLFSFGKMHKAKLYSAFDEVICKLNNQTINIIDWGCGQALATTLLIDYINEKDLNINISNITLIEPSHLALSRGLLYIDILQKDKKSNIKAINKDIDSLAKNDLIFNNDNTTLHLFSNILDVEFFRLDKEFLNKISSSQNRLNYFICVSPNIHSYRNSRLNLFYNHFNNNFETSLISSRDSDIMNYKRYEKIFKVNL